MLESKEAKEFGRTLDTEFEESGDRDDLGLSKEATLAGHDQSGPSKVKKIQDVAYTDSGFYKHKLDIFLPDPLPENAPVLVFFHGGGWVRGDRRSFFYGAPHMSRGYASRGVITVTPSYRLGRSPHHMQDAVAAVNWVHNNIRKYIGRQPSGLFLSGHSAGGNIVSLLALGRYPLECEILGVITVSGVYSLYKPLGGLQWKNYIFTLRYVWRVFGRDWRTIVANSPTCLLKLRLGVRLRLQAEHRCGIIGLDRSLAKYEYKKVHAAGAVNGQACTSANRKTKVTIAPSHRPPPPFFVLSASWDLGLETDAQRLVELLELGYANLQEEASYNSPSEATTSGEAKSHQLKYCVIPNTNHANICWKPVTHDLCADFVYKHSPSSSCSTFAQCCT